MKTKTKSVKLLAWGLLAVGLLAPATNAGEPVAPAPGAPAESHSGWEFSITPYAPLMGLKGTMGISPFLTDVDLPFNKILSHLDGAFTSYLQARNDRWSITGDFVWMKLSASIMPNPITSIGLREEETMGSLALGYSVVRTNSTTVDLLAGAAYTGLDVDITPTVLGFPGLSGSRSGSKDWIEPFVGVAFQQRLSDQWRIFGRADVGGFSGVSDEYWQATVGVGYMFNDHVGLALAYRWISMDYHKGGFVYDTISSGPCLGLTFRF